MTASRFARWWKDNPDKADEINKKRKARYHEDGAYRERVKERNRAAYHKKKPGGKRYPNPRFYPYKNSVIELWSVGPVSEFLGISKRTLANLESKGTIPINRYVDENRRRWWPKAYVEWLKPFFEARQNAKLSAQEFSNRVWRRWSLEHQQEDLPVIEEGKK